MKTLDKTFKEALGISEIKFGSEELLVKALVNAIKEAVKEDSGDRGDSVGDSKSR